MTDRPTVYNIPAGVAFVDALARGLLARHGADPLQLSRVTVLLPTRRAARALSEAFLRIGDGRPMLLPAMQPIGDVEEDLVDAGAAGGDTDLTLPPAIGGLRRQLLLTELIRQLRDVDAAQAALLAAELARLLDQMQTQGLPLEALADLAPAEFAAHWQITLDFLQVLAEPWRGLLAAEGCLDPAARRDRAIRARAAAWQAAPPTAPVIAAGSTGSIPATAELIGVVARLPAGAVVLPGLDQALDDDAWRRFDAGHPQFGLKELLIGMGVDRRDVRPWSDDDGNAGRRRLLSEATRPAETTEQWRDLPPLPADTLDGLRRIDCADSQAEAGVIALVMRRVLETPAATAALITQDRDLARRVTAELLRWGVAVDDSAGQPLKATPAGTLLRLAAELIGERAAPVPLLAALKHPLATAGHAAATRHALVRELEVKVLRGPRPAPGVAGLRQAVVEAACGDALTAFVDALAAAAQDVEALFAAIDASLPELIAAHIAFAEWLSADETGRPTLWDGDAGEAAAAFVSELHAASEGLRPIDGGIYPALFGTLIEGRVLRPRYGAHPRLSIWGPLEARLQRADLLILGGLNEGSWPPDAPADAWLSRPMRQILGLPSPERRIGLSAHDFVQAAAAPEVLLTRADRVEGTPTVPSRWLLRLDNVMAAAGLVWDEAAAADLTAWQARLDVPARIETPAPPAPRPPPAARPRRLSVTRIEVWMRDPYAIYARYIMGLKPLEPLDADPGAADRGTAVHHALDAFVRRYPDDLPDDALPLLLAAGREAFGPMLNRPGVRAFWWPRFERIARWFLALERSRRPDIRPVATEVVGKLVLAGPGGDFLLTATADRVDRLPDGGLQIIDYKTGGLPTRRELESGGAPQLPLEAAIALAGGFEGLPGADIGGLSFWRLTGGSTPGEVKPVKMDAAEAAARARAGLEALIAAFDDPATPYRARPRPDMALRFGDYDHLARLGEWSAAGEDGGAA